MKKNVASQIVGIQLVSKTDGSNVTTGTTTVYVTGDAGTQAAGTVGSGACTHEGKGFWTYAPAQAETNYDHVAYTFENTAAVTATLQIYPSFPQTGDNFARLGAPVGASISADVAAVQADTDNIQTRIPAALVSGRIDASVGAMAANVMTAAAAASDLTTELQSGLATQTSVDDLPTNAELATALGTADDAVLAQVALVKAKTDLIPASPAAVGDIPTAVANADALLNRDMSTGTDSGSTTVRTPRQALRAMRNKVSISGSTLTVTKEDDSTSSWTATVTATAGADPITAVDPAGP